MPITLDGTNGITTPSYGGADTAEYLVPVTSMKNRIINGNMAIAQRGTSAVTTDESFPVDRFQLQVVNANLSLVQSSTAPAGFNYSIAATVTSTTSSAVTDRSRLFQNIEGFNVADLDWGTANAKTITISFWARSTVTGTYSGNVTNSGGNRSYIFTYALTANTWTYVTATIAGDTSGTWLKTNGNGLGLNPITFNCGANYQGTAGSWIAGDARGTSGSTYLATSNSGAVFNITGVQLEVGSTATSFDYRPYGTELQLCQRYFQTYGYGIGSPNDAPLGTGYYFTSTEAIVLMYFSVTMRAKPTYSSATVTNGYRYSRAGASTTINSLPYYGTSSQSIAFFGDINLPVAGSAGNAVVIYTEVAGARVNFSAEL